jgi:glycosyltransferase involved in cell wall biosynthesis
MDIASPWALSKRLRARNDIANERFLAPPPAGFVEPAPAPTFSVIVAAYNVASVIADALESIRGQDVAPSEVIVCDDGSTDDLDRALEPYRAEITLLRNEHGGESSARNAASRAATGDFVLILDADDVFLPGRIRALSELASTRPDLGVLTSDAFLVANGRVMRRFYEKSWPFEAADQRQAILQRNFIFGLAAVKRELLLECGGFDESIVWTEDWDLWLRLILDGVRAGCVMEPLALYRLREESLTARRRELAIGRLGTLEKAQTNPNLRAGERAVLDSALRTYRRELALEELRASVLAGRPDVRRSALGLLTTRGYRRRVRLEIAGIAVFPALAARFLRRRAARSWVGAGGVRVRRTAELPR